MQRYFVSPLLPDDYRPSPTAVYEVQVLNDRGQGEVVVFLSGDGKVLSAQHAIKGLIAVDQSEIPPAVIDAALALRGQHGEYVDAAGRIVRPSFMGGATPAHE